MISARRAGLDRAPVLAAAVGCATTARLLVGGQAAAASVPAALVFTAILLATVVTGGARPSRVAWRQLAVGLGGGAALVAVSLVGLPALWLGARAPASTLAWWVPLVAMVAAAEELVFRGVLFDAVQARAGEVAALVLTALLFAAVHLPLYGPPALPTDLCVGLFLGCLRIGSRGVAAPLAAHVLADVATGWVG